MPKCPKCGKKFNSLQALRNHFNAVHPNERFVAPKETTSRNLQVALVAIIIVVGALIGGLIVATGRGNTTTTTAPTGILGTDINSSLYQDFNVSFSTLASIGSGGSGVSAPSSIASSPLKNGALPEILYIGAEFCPYCGAERWALVVALSKFGNFTGLEYMQSADDDPSPAGVPTLTFLNANYTSKYLSFVTVENEDRNHDTLQVPNGEEETLWNEYNPNAFPFVDIGGQFDLTTSQYDYNDLVGLNWTQVGSQLNNVSSPIAQVIDGSANNLISAICQITNQSPASVCGETYLKSIPVAFTAPSTGGVSQAFQALVIFPAVDSGLARVGKSPL
jgi:hypothetical protein